MFNDIRKHRIILTIHVQISTLISSNTITCTLIGLGSYIKLHTCILNLWNDIHIHVHVYNKHYQFEVLYNICYYCF